MAARTYIILPIVLLALLCVWLVGLWGVGGLYLFYWLLFYGGIAVAMIVAKIAVIANVLVGAYLLWKLHRVVKRDISTPDNAFTMATRLWLLSYVALYIYIALSFWQPQVYFSHWINQKANLLQFPMVIALTSPVALLSFYLKRASFRVR